MIRIPLHRTDAERCLAARRADLEALISDLRSRGENYRVPPSVHRAILRVGNGVALQPGDAGALRLRITRPTTLQKLIDVVLRVVLRIFHIGIRVSDLDLEGFPARCEAGAVVRDLRSLKRFSCPGSIPTFFHGECHRQTIQFGSEPPLDPVPLEAADQRVREFAEGLRRLNGDRDVTPRMLELFQVCCNQEFLVINDLQVIHDLFPIATRERPFSTLKFHIRKEKDVWIIHARKGIWAYRSADVDSFANPQQIVLNVRLTFTEEGIPGEYVNYATVYDSTPGLEIDFS